MRRPHKTRGGVHIPKLAPRGTSTFREFSKRRKEPVITAGHKRQPFLLPEIQSFVF